MTKQEEIIRLALDKGYLVDKEGKVHNCLGIELSLSKNKKGYLSFNIRLNGGNPTRLFVHKLQGFQKFGEKIFEDDIVIRHLNGLSTDNSYKNINIGSQSENMMDVPKVKRVVNASNPKYPHKDIVEDYKKGLTYSELGLKYKIKSKGTISFIIKKSLISAN